MGLKVCKFGGSSLSDAEQFKKVKSIIEADRDRKVVVVSAPGKRFKGDHKVTDLLYLCSAHMEYGVSFDYIFDLIADRFNEIRSDLGLNTDIGSDLDEIRAGIGNGADKEWIASRGEYLSAKLMADFLGYEFLDAALWLKFKYDGTVDEEESYGSLYAAAEGKRIVTPGFFGVMPGGKVKTLTRGGSDVTGALAAAALEADVYENWTDVPGILMADPSIVPNPKPIKLITYAELRELSFLGAKVLHAGSVMPVREKNIPLNIRDTNDPSQPGTLILNSISDDDGDDGNFITGIAGKKGYSVITVLKSGMSSDPEALLKILEITAAHNVNVEYIPSGIDIISLVVSASKAEDSLYSILAEIQKALKPDNIKVTEHMAIVAAVGRKMVYKPGTSGKIFATLGENGVNIRMITQGPEELDIIVGVEEKDFEQAVRILYNTFIKEKIS